METPLTTREASALAYEMLQRQPEPALVTRITLPWSIELASVKQGDTVQLGDEIFTVVGWQETSDHHGCRISYDMVPYVQRDRDNEWNTSETTKV